VSPTSRETLRHKERERKEVLLAEVWSYTCLLELSLGEDVGPRSVGRLFKLASKSMNLTLGDYGDEGREGEDGVAFGKSTSWSSRKERNMKTPLLACSIWVITVSPSGEVLVFF